jgi:catechol 2,3-dioxygenase-like lactoylglutathione lyase family enzyme
MSDWPGGVAAITLFVADVTVSRDWYARTFAQSAVFEDANSAVFRFGDTMVNLLQRDRADELVTPHPVAAPRAGAGQLFTLSVDDVDATCAELATRGVVLLNGPMDRPWGIRTAAFQDLDGYVWEVAR